MSTQMQGLTNLDQTGTMDDIVTTAAGRVKADSASPMCQDTLTKSEGFLFVKGEKAEKLRLALPPTKSSVLSLHWLSNKIVRPPL